MLCLFYMLKWSNPSRSRIISLGFQKWGSEDSLVGGGPLPVMEGSSGLPVEAQLHKTSESSLVIFLTLHITSDQDDV